MKTKKHEEVHGEQRPPQGSAQEEIIAAADGELLLVSLEERLLEEMEEEIVCNRWKDLAARISFSFLYLWRPAFLCGH